MYDIFWLEVERTFGLTNALRNPSQTCHQRPCPSLSLEKALWRVDTVVPDIHRFIYLVGRDWLSVCSD